MFQEITSNLLHGELIYVVNITIYQISINYSDYSMPQELRALRHFDHYFVPSYPFHDLSFHYSRVLSLQLVADCGIQPDILVWGQVSLPKVSGGAGAVVQDLKEQRKVSVQVLGFFRRLGTLVRYSGLMLEEWGPREKSK